MAGLHRYAQRRDHAERVLINLLKQRGVSTWQLSSKNIPDLLCLIRGRFVLVEVKTGKAKLSTGQREFMAFCNLQDAPVFVIRSESDLELMLQVLEAD